MRSLLLIWMATAMVACGDVTAPRHSGYSNPPLTEPEFDCRSGYNVVTGDRDSSCAAPGQGTAGPAGGQARGKLPHGYAINCPFGYIIAYQSDTVCVGNPEQ